MRKKKKITSLQGRWKRGLLLFIALVTLGVLFLVEQYSLTGNVVSDTLSVPAPSLLTRELPTEYTPGTSFLVTLHIVPSAAAHVYAVEDLPPAGWAVDGTSISDDGAYDVVTSKVKWIFFDILPRNLSYTVTPPLAVSGVHTFSGITSFDGDNYAVTGDSELSAAISAPKGSSGGSSGGASSSAQIAGVADAILPVSQGGSSPAAETPTLEVPLVNASLSPLRQGRFIGRVIDTFADLPGSWIIAGILIVAGAAWYLVVRLLRRRELEQLYT